MNHLFRSFVLLGLAFLALFNHACNSTKGTVYFSDTTTFVPTTSVQTITSKNEPVIQVDDILAINVTSVSSILADKTGDPTTIYNMGGTNFNLTAGGGGQAAAGGGYLVNSKGSINFPVLGDVPVAGMKISDAKRNIEDRLKSQLKEPVVEVRIINYKVTVLGEVGKPGQVIAPNHNITILDAIAASGDIPITGRKDNIQLIREVNGTREYVKLDLTNKDIMNSPYYYLKQNDVLIVDASKVRKQERNTFTRVVLPVLASVIGVAASIVTLAITASR